MIRLKESILIKKSLVEAFRYTSDFSHIQDWDPGVASSNKIHPKAVGVGSIFNIVLRFGPFRPKMTYEIIEYEPNFKVVLKGEGESFSATDTIVFTKTAVGIRIDYQADIRFAGIGRYIEVILSPIMKRIGEKAMLGLEQKLGGTQNRYHKKSWFKSGSGLIDYLADHSILPGMMMFSSYGYDLSRRFWTEPSNTLYGKRVVLTGGTSGIGRAAAFKLAKKKAYLTIIARNRTKAEQVRQEIVDQTGNPNIDFLIADLSLMQDIKKVSEKIRQSKKSIDILINNAGALFNKHEQTSEGIEQTFATDLLGVFYLTELLKDTFKRSSDSRIINVSSGGMYTQNIDLEDFENCTGQYNGAKAYARAKRGIVMMTRVWADHLKEDGICVHSMHPGWVDTPGIERSLPGFHQIVNPVLRTPEQGADTIVWLAISRQAGQCSGLFWLDRRPHETAVFPGTYGSKKNSVSLWHELNRIIASMKLQ